MAENFETIFKIIHVPCSEFRHHILPTTALQLDTMINMW
jgi:hypothetical protein